MSDKPAPEKLARSKFNHLKSDPVTVNFQPMPLLAQFSAATAPNYSPASQAQNPAPAAVEKSSPQISTPTPSPSVTASNPTSKPNPSSSTSSLVVKPPPTAASASTATASSTLKPLPYQVIELSAFKGTKFVSLDGLQTVTREVYDKISGTFQWEACEGQEEYCVNFIKDDCANKRVFLVAAGGLGAKIVPKIHHFPQLYAVYIYCVDVEGHKKWAKDFSKVRVVCDNDDRFLLPQLAVDVAQTFVEWGDALLKQGKRDEAVKKYKDAELRLNEYARNHDPAMDADLKRKLAQCA